MGELTSKEPCIRILSDIIMDNLSALELYYKEDIESLESKNIDSKKVTGEQ